MCSNRVSPAAGRVCNALVNRLENHLYTLWWHQAQQFASVQNTGHSIDLMSLIWPLKFQSIIDQNNFSKLHVWSSLCSCHPSHHSRLHSELFKNAHKTVHHLASPLLFQTLWTPPVTLPTLQPSWTIGNCPRTPRPPTLQAMLHVCSFLEWPFPCDMFQFTLQDLVQIQSSVRSVLQLPQAVNVSVTFDFFTKTIMFALEFLPFPWGGKKVPYTAV